MASESLIIVVMSFSLVYLVQRFFYRIFEFLRHWYIGSFLVIAHQTLNILEILDRVLALRVTLHYLFKPLYQEYTFLGYAFGFIFRSIRMLIAVAIYVIIIVIAFGVYLVWAAVPIYILYKGFYG